MDGTNGKEAADDRVSWSERFYRLFATAPRSPLGRAVRAAEILLIAFSIASIIAGTVPSTAATLGGLFSGFVDVTLVIFTITYVARLIAEAVDPLRSLGQRWPARLDWARSPSGLIDLVAVVPMWASLAFGVDAPTVRLIGMVWVLKLARYSTGLGMLGRVLRNEREALLSVFGAFATVLLMAATLAYVFESKRQPDTFGTLPNALWWTITTLTTTGYGDVVPVTPLGRLLGGTVMVCGIGVFALWAGILATGFAQEFRRRDFLRTWDLVAKVPFLRDIGPAAMTEIARMLRPREVAPGNVVVRRGQAGDSMFFIVSGEIEIELEPHPLRLGPGAFFGEIALITGGPRTATALARRRTTLLMLDIADFREVAQRHPELGRIIQDEGERRLSQASPAAQG